MAAMTEKDLEDKRAKNAKLREQIADAQAKASTVTQEQNVAIEGKQLDAETARLENTLQAAREAAKVANIRSGASNPLDAVTEQLAAAQVEITPPGVTVDTNPSEADSSVSTNTNGGNS